MCRTHCYASEKQQTGSFLMLIRTYISLERFASSNSQHRVVSESESIWKEDSTVTTYVSCKLRLATILDWNQIWKHPNTPYHSPQHLLTTPNIEHKYTIGHEVSRSVLFDDNANFYHSVKRCHLDKESGETLEQRPRGEVHKQSFRFLDLPRGKSLVHDVFRGA